MLFYFCSEIFTLINRKMHTFHLLIIKGDTLKLKSDIIDGPYALQAYDARISHHRPAMCAESLWWLFTVYKVKIKSQSL